MLRLNIPWYLYTVPRYLLVPHTNYYHDTCQKKGFTIVHAQKPVVQSWYLFKTTMALTWHHVQKAQFG